MMKALITVAVIAVCVAARSASATSIAIDIGDGSFESGINTNGYTHWSGSGSFGGGGSNYAANLDLAIAGSIEIPETGSTLSATDAHLFGYSLASVTTTEHSDQWTQVNAYGYWTHIFDAKAGDTLMGDYFSYLSAGGDARSDFFVGLYLYDPVKQDRGALVVDLVDSNPILSGSSWNPWTAVSYLITATNTYQIYAEGGTVAYGASSGGTSDFGLDAFHLDRELAVPETSTLVLMVVGLVAYGAVWIARSV